MLPPASVIFGYEDCACAATTAGLKTPLANPRGMSLSMTTYSVPLESLILDRLPNHFSGLFNPQSAGGVVVVNPPARQVFDFFRTPRQSSELIEYFPDYAEPELNNAVTLFAQLELLAEVGKPRPRQTQPSTKLTAWLHVTDACNLACPYCYLKKSGHAMDEATGFLAVKAVFRSALAEKFKTVKLKYAGGEATLNFPLVIKLHDYATQLAAQNQLSLEAVILSNGAALTAERIREIKQRNIRVMISLDGLGVPWQLSKPPDGMM